MSDSETILRSAISAIPDHLRDKLDLLSSIDLHKKLQRTGPNLFDHVADAAEALPLTELESLKTTIGGGSPTSTEPKKSISSFLSEVLRELGGSASLTNDDVLAKFQKKLGGDGLSIQDRAIMNTLYENTHASLRALAEGDALKAIEKAAERQRDLEGILSAARNVSFGPGHRVQTALPDWDGLITLFAKAIHGYEARSKLDKTAFPVFSLLHVYWLDEGGVFWAAERLADRLHNGVVPSTAPLKSVRVQPISLAMKGIAAFSRWWRQGLLCAVAERAAQYSALYGYPLHIAGRTGRAQYLDSLTSFPGALNGALVRALHYYRDRRNTWITADVAPSRQAFDALARVLDIGEENLRLIKPVEFRAQLETIKLLLGGTSSPVPTPPLVLEWRTALSPRPGIAESLPPWVTTVDTVAERYALRPVTIQEYSTLAELGEALLFVVRLVHVQSGGLGSIDEGTFRAFLDLIEDWVQRYVAAYATVTGVDLRSEATTAAQLAEPPAVHLAARYPAPAIGPLRDEWPKPVLAAR